MAIYPVFLPHAGCPHRCSFCQQVFTTGVREIPDPVEVFHYLDTVLPQQGEGEVAYYGGSFTLLPDEEQRTWLALARRFNEQGRIRGIRLSTRPDAIDPVRGRFLASSGVTTVELGVQSFDATVLRRSGRGYSPDCIPAAVAALRDHGIALGLHLMPGLPGGDEPEAVASLRSALALRPDFLRIHPTVVLRDTLLHMMYVAGTYVPLTLDRAVRLCARLWQLSHAAGIPVVRCGLQETDRLIPGETVVAGPYHPAFGQLVRAQLWFEVLSELAAKGVRDWQVHPADYSDAIGHRRSNLAALRHDFGGVAITTDIHLPRRVLAAAGSQIHVYLPHDKGQFSMTERSSSDYRSGFVALIGQPNVGKSTLLNRILGQKIAITSSKPQTTRNRILGIAHLPTAQVLFLDTPGIHEGRGKLNRYMVEQATSACSEVDLILYLVDVTAPHPQSRNEVMILQHLQASGRPVFLVLNKIDAIPRERLLPLIGSYADKFPFREIIPVSAATGDGVDHLLEEVRLTLPLGPPYYPDDMVTDLPERFIVGEMIREQLLRQLRDEVPFLVAVAIEDFHEEPERNLVVIHAAINVSRDSHKGIVIGKQGAALRAIGQSSRREIEKFLGCKVFLQLFVKVQKDWTESSRLLREFGYQ